MSTQTKQLEDRIRSLEARVKALEVQGQGTRSQKPENPAPDSGCNSTPG